MKLPETVQHILLKQNVFMMYTLIQASMEKYKSIEAMLLASGFATRNIGPSTAALAPSVLDIQFKDT